MATRRRSQRRGTAAVETAILLPFLLALVYGVWEVGRFIQVAQVVSNSAREGVRQAACGTLSSSTAGTVTSGTVYQVQSYVANYLQNAGLPMSGTVTITVTNETQNLVSTITATAGATYPNLTYTKQGNAPTTDPVQNAKQSDVMRVDVSYPYDPTRWIPAGSYVSLGAGQNLLGTCRWNCVRDLPIVVTTTIPSAPQ